MDVGVNDSLSERYSNLSSISSLLRIVYNLSEYFTVIINQLVVYALYILKHLSNKFDIIAFTIKLNFSMNLILNRTKICHIILFVP